VISSIQCWVSDFQAALLPVGSLRARFVKGTFWVLLGTLISQGMQLAATVFVARWIGKSEYGELGIVTSTVGMFGVFVGLGLGLTATKYVSELRQEDPLRAGRIAALTLTMALVSGSAITAVLILLSPWLATHTLASPSVATPLAIGSGLLFLGELNGVQASILSGFEAFGAIARVSLSAGLCSLPIIITTTSLWGLKGAVSGLVLSVAVNCILTNTALRHEADKAGVPISFSGSWKEKVVLWKFSAPAFLASAVVTPIAWICNTMLVNQPNGYAEMGLFSAANQWRNIILFLPGIISRVLLPILSSHSRESASEASRFSNSLAAGFSAGVAVAFPLVTLLNFASTLIAGAYGKDFAAMIWPLAGLSYTGGVLAIGTPVGLAVQAKGAMWLGFVSNLYWAVLLLGFFHFFFVHGAWGLANAWASSYFLLNASALWFFCKAGYYPWRLGIRTNLACIALLPFAFGPLCLSSPSLTLRLCPIALLLAIITTWLLIPPDTARALLPTANGLSWRRKRA
jgi:O-antigen/teichoic acid export membrane protein